MAARRLGVKTVERKPAAKKAPARKERRSATPAEPAPSYFASGATKGSDILRFVSSGCAVLDEALGGGYVLGRCANIVGDKSAGKTLSAMEIIANFCLKYDGPVRYAESEAAFDEAYAGALGMPLDRIMFNPDGQPMQTVEDLYDDLEKFLDLMLAKKATEGVYVIDSLDALSMDAELDEEFNKDSFGGAKPKAIGQLFRRLVRRMEDMGVLFVVVSQIRDVMNAKPFQETKKRSGGKALDFYATHIVWLTETGKIKRTVAKLIRVVGIDVLARVRKNKIGLPFREASYPLLFGYGIDDMTASIDWLIANNREAMLADLGMSKAGYPTLVFQLRNEGGQEARSMRDRLSSVVRREWANIETSFLPKASKY